MGNKIKIKEGDTVIIRKPEKITGIRWIGQMDYLNGKKIVIEKLYAEDRFFFEGWSISLDWCEKVSGKPPAPKPRRYKKSKKKKLKKRIKELERVVDIIGCAILERGFKND